MLTIKAELSIGSDIKQNVRDAIRLAKHLEVCVEIEHNKVTLFITENDNLYVVLNEYDKKFDLMCKRLKGETD
jgi:hypothetical protein